MRSFFLALFPNEVEAYVLPIKNMVQIILMEEQDKISLSLDFPIFSGNRNTVGEKSQK